MNRIYLKKKNTMKYTILLAALLPITAGAQTITFTWPGVGEETNTFPHCSTRTFLAPVAEWVGVESCVLNGGGRHLGSFGWPAEPGSAFVRLSCLAYAPVMLDSIIIVHRRGSLGPDRLRVSLVAADGVSTVAEDGIANDYRTTRIALHRALVARDGNEYERVNILLEAAGGEGAWDLLSVRIVGSPMPVVTDVLPTLLLTDRFQKRR